MSDMLAMSRCARSGAAWLPAPVRLPASLTSTCARTPPLHSLLVHPACIGPPFVTCTGARLGCFLPRRPRRVSLGTPYACMAACAARLRDVTHPYPPVPQSFPPTRSMASLVSPPRPPPRKCPNRIPSAQAALYAGRPLWGAADAARPALLLPAAASPPYFACVTPWISHALGFG
ncbi:MAG: hypothetical protein J3K34DRAFT_439361 [Monoraphidium minutum]|nr:MAG: hypothetical protein J3K34DRAFT_439361 [Monoraphidium minutum]